MSPAPPPRPPDFLCVGTARAGTTWLYSMLARTPGFWMPPHKELQFFSPGGPTSNLDQKLLVFHQAFDAMVQQKRVDPRVLRWFSQLTLDEAQDAAWYLRLFAPAGRRVAGDLTPAAFLLDGAGVDQAARLLGPRGRVLVLLRQPVDRALSQARQLMARGGWPADLDGDALLERLLSPGFLPYGHYQTALSRWEAAWGRERVGVFFYEDLQRDPVAHLRQICAFVGHPIAPADVPAAARPGGPRVNPSPERPFAPAVSAALARALLPEIEPLAARFPDPVGRWCAELRALSAGGG